MLERNAHTEPAAIDARVAVLAALAYSVAIFFVDTWAGMAAFALLLAGVLWFSHARLTMVFKSLVPLWFILAFTVLAHIPQGIDEGFFYAIRIALLAIATLVVAFSYDDTQLVRAFVWFMQPLRALKVPVDDIATMFSIAVRFIPVCMQEFLRVADAQRCRAAHFDDGGIVARVKQWGSVLMPMLVGLFRRASSLANAMEARCYGGGLRTSLHGDQRLRAVDYVLICVAIGLCAAGAVAF